MKLQGRNLSASMQGPDVALLQRELRKLGFAIPSAEFQRKTFGDATQQAVREFQKAHKLAVTGVVNEHTATAINAAVDALEPQKPAPSPQRSKPEPSPQTQTPVPARQPSSPAQPPPPKPPGFVVKGHVSQADDSRVVGHTVRALDKDMRTEQLLGEDVTDKNGRYEIEYAADKFRRAEKGSADLIVRVLSKDGRVLAASPVIFDAGAEETVDLTLDTAATPLPSEYERLLNKLKPYLQDTPLIDLTEEDIKFLQGATGIDPLRIVYLMLAARRSAKINVPAEAFYGLFRQDMPTQPGALLLQTPEALRFALETSTKKNIIPTVTGPQIDNIIETFAQPRHLLEANGGDAIPALKVLETTTLPPEKQAKFLHLYNRYDGSSESFWQSLRDSHEFDDTQIKELQTTLQLGQLTRNNAPLIRALKTRRAGVALRDLAAMSESDWLELIQRPSVDVPEDVPGETDEEKRKNYAHEIAQDVATAFPTATLAAALARDNRPEQSDVKKFFANAPDFDFDAHVDSYVTANDQQAHAGIKDKEGLRRQLKAMQRVSRVTPRHDHMQALMDGGLDSAYAISSLPEGSFLEQFADKLGGETQAKTYHARARRITERAALVSVNARQAVSDVSTRATGNGSSDKKAPNFTTLFGDSTICACEECRSVLSPAAYLVDLLQMINPPIGPKPIEHLRRRRPDIEQLQLSCENTNTLLPYVDLVNEVMEFYVAHAGHLANLPAHNTMDQPAKDLSVSPQYTNNRAYQKLQEAVYPPSLPFNRPVTMARAYLEHLGSSRYQVMQTFTADETPATERAIAADYLKITEAEYQILTGKNFDGSDLASERNAVELYGYESPDFPELKRDATGRAVRVLQRLLETVAGQAGQKVTGVFGPNTEEAVKAFQSSHRLAVSGIVDDATWAALKKLEPDIWQLFLRQVPEFLQRTGLSYSELSELLNTHWINPDPQAAGAVVVSSPDSDCDLAEMAIHHLNGNRLDDGALQRINRFIRLWRKLGWSMRDLDKALIALNAQRITPQLLRQLAEVVRLQSLLKLPLAQLLSFWSNLDTDGRDSLYVQLFQSKAAVSLPGFKLVYATRLDKQPNVTFPDSVKDKIGYDAAAKRLTFIGGMTSEEQRLLTSNGKPDGFERAIERLFQMRWFEGIELAQDGRRISHFKPAILSALGISAGDLRLIRVELGLNTPDAPLNIATLSALYRHSVLAKAMRLRISDLLALKTLTGIDPFAGPGETTKFLEQARQIQESDFSVAQLDYLYRHRSTLQDGVRPQRSRLLVLAKVVRDGLAQIEQDNSIAEDPTGELIRARLALFFESTIVDQIMQMVEGSTVYTAPLGSFASESSFPPEALKNKVSYNAVARTLQFRGPMTSDERNALITASADAEYQAVVANLFNQPREFIGNTLGGFLDQQEGIKGLLETPSVTSDGKPDANAIAGKLSYMLDRFLPYLRARLSVSFVKQTIADELKLDSAMTDLLLERRTLLSSRADKEQPAKKDFLELRKGGLTGHYFKTNDLSDDATRRVDAKLAFDGSGTGARTTIPTGTGSVRWTGMLLVPKNDDYTFSVRASGGLRLWLGDNPKPAIDAAQDASETELNGGPITLKAGQLYDLRLEVTHLSSPAIAELRWSSAATPKDLIPSQSLYPASVLHTFIRTFTSLQKIAQLVNGFKLTPNELTYMNRHAGRFADLSLDSLPVDRSEDTDTLAPALFRQWRRLNDFVTLRDSLPQGEVGLIDVFKAASLDDARKQLMLATGWETSNVDALIGGLKLTEANFKNDVAITRLQACMQLIKRLGVSADQLFEWAGTTPGANQADDIAQTVKAKYDDASWRTIGKALNDELRSVQKAALIDYMLADGKMAARGIVDANQLFEYLLIDVEMGTCMRTSRIKQAISSVQLFIQRCLMNLEKHVRPSAIDEEHWEWMKNYRVWEANRKVFLYPENWIEPELRDDKSPFFEELENQLLQDDVTAETAEQAFVSYLEKLDEVRRLEICGMYSQSEDDDGEATDILHVFGRTRNKPPTYYYRQLIDGKLWTPWEKVNLDIQSDHLIPVVHDRRLYLFWPIFEETADKNQLSGTPFIESKPHWDWIRKNEEWKVRDRVWQRIYDLWKSLKAIDQKFDSDDDPDTRPNFANTFVRNLNDNPEPSLKHFDPNDEPRQPAKPQASTRPTLTHWEIKLAWSEYRQNKWGPKQTSSSFVRSPNVIKKAHAGWLAKEHLQRKYVDAYIGEHGGVRDREIIVQLYLPSPEEHFFRTTIEDGELVLKLYRRYHHEFEVLGSKWQYPMKSYDRLGEFSISGCGEKVRAVSGFKEHFKDYGSLARPDGTRNSFMTLAFNADGKKDGSLKFRDGKKKVLREAGGHFNLLCEHQLDAHRGSPFQRFFYQDGQRTYLVDPKRKDAPFRSDRTALDLDSKADDSMVSRFKAGADNDGHSKSHKAADQLQFTTLFHPHVCAFIKALNHKGIPGLLRRYVQEFDNDDHDPKLKTKFAERYRPTDLIRKYPRENVDFDQVGAYSLYNWELFFHAPMLIATRLCDNQKFEDAQEWFHYIFNPTSSSGLPIPQRYWQTLPFFKNADPQNNQIHALLSALESNQAGAQPINEEIEAQIDAWQDDPFNPHLIARMRVIAYQKNVLMKYVENLIAWGDQLFGQDTLETVNQATLLYVLASDVLGPRPEIIPSKAVKETHTYAELKSGPDSSSDAKEQTHHLVRLENEAGRTLASSSSGRHKAISARTTAKRKQKNRKNKHAHSVRSIAGDLYFGIPPNDNLLQYWETVADRLFKIRNCMNLEGVVRELPLFEPPIDPALLVRAAAMGLDLGSVLNDVNAPSPYYRFGYMLQKAVELTSELKSFGAALLTALEKKDGEALAMLRAGLETSLLKAIRDVKQQQIVEANQTLEGIRKTREVTNERYKFYKQIEFMNAEEGLHMGLSALASVLQIAAQAPEIEATVSYALPDQTFGIAGSFGSPLSICTIAGRQTGDASASFSKALGTFATFTSMLATMTGTLGGFHRRWDDWKLQERLTSKELEHIDKQIAAAEIRVAITEKELANHDKQIDNAAGVEDFLRNKYTNQELYDWMLSKLSAMYFQSYKLAYDVAKRAERAYRFERGLTTSNFIQFGYWDSRRKGLLSGEQLHQDLKRMEMAYLDQNKRDYEITKHISLMMNDPLALIALKETGQCEISLPEALFDADYPGHYMRRIKNVSLTIPCVVGPYTGINCTLTLLNNRTRIKSTAGKGITYRENQDGEDDRFVTNFAALQSIATSHAQNDSGMFELNFRDERYLPFELAGAISRWRIELPKDTNAFDFDTISDVILNLNYTARDGGKPLQAAARDALGLLPWTAANTSAASTDLLRLFSLKHEFPTEWHRFLNPSDFAAAHTLTLTLTPERFSFLLRGKRIALEAVTLFLKMADDFNYVANGHNLTIHLTQNSQEQGEPGRFGTAGSPITGLPFAKVDITSGDIPRTLVFEVLESDLPTAKATEATWWQSVNVNGVDHTRLRPKAIEDIWIVCRYSAT